MMNPITTGRRLLLTASLVLGIFVLSMAVAGFGYKRLAKHFPEGFQASSLDGIYIDARTIDLGTVVTGSRSEAAFTLFNVSDETVRLGTPKSNCSCTTAVLDRFVLLPQERATLKVSYSAPAVAIAEFSQGVSLAQEGDINDRKAMVFAIRGSVVFDKPFWVFPDEIVLTDSTSSQNSFIYVRGPLNVLQSLPESLTLSTATTKVRTDSPRSAASVADGVKAIRIKLANEVSSDLSELKIMFGTANNESEVIATTQVRRAAGVLAHPQLLILAGSPNEMCSTEFKINDAMISDAMGSAAIHHTNPSREGIDLMEGTQGRYRISVRMPEKAEVLTLNVVDASGKQAAQITAHLLPIASDSGTTR